jgi:hypothetical protein
MAPRTIANKLSVAGLLVAAAGMVLQISAGSDLYPTYSGPIVLLVTAVIVTLWLRRWIVYLAIIVPLALGLGAIAAAFMTGEFIVQLTDTSRAGIFVGSLMHVTGLVAAVAAGVGMLLGRPARGATDVAVP